MLAKNLPSGQAVWKIPFRVLLDAVSAWKSLFGGEATYFIAVFHAHFGFLKWLFSGKRSTASPRRKTNSLHGWYNKSVVWKHFISGKNSFAEIVGDKG